MKTHVQMFISMLLVFGVRVFALDSAAPAPAANGDSVPAQTPMQKWLAATDAQWQAVFRRDIGPLNFGNGEPTSFILWPRHDGEGQVKYERNTPYKVAIVVGQKTVQLYVDDKLIITAPGFKDRVDKLEFSAGDGWSRGSAEFRDIVLAK